MQKKYWSASIGITQPISKMSRHRATMSPVYRLVLSACARGHWTNIFKHLLFSR